MTKEGNDVVGFMDIGGIPAVLQTGDREDRGSDMGYWWIFALVIIFFALIFWRGNNRDGSGVADIAALGALGNMGHGERGSGADSRADSRAAFSELNGRLDALSQQVGHINDVNDLRDLKSTQALLNQNVTQQAFNLSSQIATNRTDTLLNFKDIALQTAQSNCDIRRDVEGIRFQNAQDTCAIINAVNSGTQRTIDFMAASERDRLRDLIAEKDRALLDRDFRLSQANQSSFIERQSDRIIGALTPPCPAPSYSVFPPIPVNTAGYTYREPRGSFCPEPACG